MKLNILIKLCLGKAFFSPESCIVVLDFGVSTAILVKALSGLIRSLVVRFPLITLIGFLQPKFDIACGLRYE